jgi:hypothetical protein
MKKRIENLVKMLQKIRLKAVHIIRVCARKGFARGSSHSVLLAFSHSYIEHDLRKNKIVVPFFW